MLLACAALLMFEQPVGHSTQGFVNRVTVEVCGSQWMAGLSIRWTEQLVSGDGGRPVGAPRTNTQAIPTREEILAQPPPPEYEAPSVLP